MHYEANQMFNGANQILNEAKGLGLMNKKKNLPPQSSLQANLQAARSTPLLIKTVSRIYNK